VDARAGDPAQPGRVIAKKLLSTRFGHSSTRTSAAVPRRLCARPSAIRWRESLRSFFNVSCRKTRLDACTHTEVSQRR